MSDRFRFDDPFVPVPPGAVDADPAQAFRELVQRVGQLEEAAEEQRARARAELAEAMLELVSLADEVTNIIERWGITTRAQDAAIAASVLALGKKLLVLLKYHRIEPINTLGAPLDPRTSDVVGYETRDNMDPNVVLREVQTGYTWPHGLLRRAQVVVSTHPPDGIAGEKSMEEASGRVM